MRYNGAAVGGVAVLARAPSLAPPRPLVKTGPQDDGRYQDPRRRAPEGAIGGGAPAGHICREAGANRKYGCLRTN